MSNLILGLDLGVASVGWALIEENERIVDLGVRAFSKAENDKDGKPLNLTRRESRLVRRRLKHRVNRLNKLLNFLIKENLITQKTDIQRNIVNQENPWQLRISALHRLLTKEELARIIYHICKHRGFYWANSGEATDEESGKIKKNLSSNQSIMKSKGYLTIAQMLVCEFPNKLRNSTDDYSKSISRIDLANELKLIFEKQKSLGADYITESLVNGILGNGDCKSGFLWQQKIALQGDQLLSMVSNCRFEKDEKRAAKETYLAQRHIWLTKLLNLRIADHNLQQRQLTVEELNIVKDLPYDLVAGVTFAHIRKCLEGHNLWNANEYSFIGLDYKAKNNPEKKVLHKIASWHSLKKSIESVDPALWQTIYENIKTGNSTLYDNIASVLTVYKDDSEVQEQLSKLNLPKAVIYKLLTIRFKEFISLSTKALAKIIPFMERGFRYDEACTNAGYKHYLQTQDKIIKTKYLPPLFVGRDQNNTLIFNDTIGDMPRNPVVLRTINQTRKVVNAVIKKYGSLASIHIEVARDLSKPYEERKQIEQANKENQNRREKERKAFLDELHLNVDSVLCNGKNLEKYRLYKEQDCKSLYSGKQLDIQRLFEPGYVEVDHILPYSRSFDDSISNRVLVLTKENRDKGNRTPYEYLNVAGLEKWEAFVARVSSNKLLSKSKKSKLLIKNFSDREKAFKERNLNDTRYICKFMKNYIDNFLLFQNNSKERCVVVAGQLTAILRKRWGLNKSRAENDRHHALDAAVIACCSRSIVQKTAFYARYKEIQYCKTPYESLDSKEFDYYGSNTVFPHPWPNFREELIYRLTIDSKEELINALKGLDNYRESDLANVRPLFVSRMCEKIGKGQLHEAGIHSQNTDELKQKSLVISKIPLTNIQPEDISPEKLVDYDRNKNLYEAIKKRLDKVIDKISSENSTKNKNDLPKAIQKEFTENPMHMPDKTGQENSTMPLVKSIKKIEKLTGFPVRKGIAKNGDMLRVDVFKKKNKYFIVPVYSWNKELPNSAAVAHKTINDWAVIDNSYDWCFSIYRNELIKLVFKNKQIFGYFKKFNIANASIEIQLHDKQSSNKIKDGVISSIGVKSALIFEKYFVDVLGYIHKAPQEARRELA